uniref:Uncharacterized protein n=1 Tax=Panagrolaimus sp. PS1159 TaxID=55785 RepID=A0AC35FHV1_9BILA
MGAYAFYYISEIWTTANHENVSVFIGTNELYFKFNSSTAIQFKNVGFFSKAYTIKIPAKTSIFIKFRQYDTFFKVLSPPTQFSVLATPFYGTWNKIFYNETFVEYDIGRQTVTFTVVNYKTSKNFEFYFIANGSKM